MTEAPRLALRCSAKAGNPRAKVGNPYIKEDCPALCGAFSYQKIIFSSQSKLFSYKLFALRSIELYFDYFILY